MWGARARIDRLTLLALLLSACTPEPEAKPERAPKRRERPAPVPIAAPAPDPEPSPTPVASEPTLIPAPPSQWWCLCYQRRASEGPEPVTACREAQDQCHKLEQRIEKGNDDIIAGSLSVGCRSLVAGHPGDVAGTREQWQPSKLRGAWVAEGACLLNDMRTNIEPELAPPPEPVAPEPEPADHSGFVSSELIGDLAIGRSSAEIRSRHGEALATGAVEQMAAGGEMAATGEWLQDWTYADGLVLTMGSTTRSGPQTVAAITIEAPSQLRTRRGVGIGDTRAAVERAYGDVEADDYEPDQRSFVAGSVYGGLFFSFEDGVVSRIFLGAGAE